MICTLSRRSFLRASATAAGGLLVCAVPRFSCGGAGARPSAIHAEGLPAGRLRRDQAGRQDRHSGEPAGVRPGRADGSADDPGRRDGRGLVAGGGGARPRRRRLQGPVLRHTDGGRFRLDRTLFPAVPRTRAPRRARCSSPPPPSAGTSRPNSAGQNRASSTAPTVNPRSMRNSRARPRESRCQQACDSRTRRNFGWSGRESGDSTADPSVTAR